MADCECACEHCWPEADPNPEKASSHSCPNEHNHDMPITPQQRLCDAVFADW